MNKTQKRRNIKETANNTINNINKTQQQKQKSYYAKRFNNTEFIPATQITNYMKKNFTEFEKKPKEPSEFFDFEVIQREPGERTFSFDLPIHSKPGVSLDELIAYSFYVKSKNAFTNNANEYLETLKNQIGKDIGRGDRTINGIFYSGREYFGDDKTNYQKADILYKLFISFFQSNGGTIDYNIINKLSLLSCQNMYNFITDLLTITLNEILAPEENTVFNAIKSEYIKILPQQKTMELSFKSELIISRDVKNGEFMDPEYPCGNLDFVLLFDFTNNTFEFTKFRLDFDLDKCGPPTEEGNNTETKKKKSNIDLRYAVPVSLGVGGLVALPFLLGALGGKKSRKNAKIRKTRKTRKTKRKKY